MTELTVDILQGLIQKYLDEDQFTVVTGVLDEDTRGRFVRLKKDPQRFLPDIFSGSWSMPSSHPTGQPIRFLRVMTGQDGVTRIIGRQGKYLYAFPA